MKYILLFIYLLINYINDTHNLKIISILNFIDENIIDAIWSTRFKFILFKIIQD